MSKVKSYWCIVGFGFTCFVIGGIFVIGIDVHEVSDTVKAFIAAAICVFFFMMGTESFKYLK